MDPVDARWFEALVERVRARAKELGAELIADGPLPADAIDALREKIAPHFGECTFVPPPSYRAFLATVGSLRVEGGDADEHDFWILGPEDVASHTSDLVHVPEGVEWARPDGSLCEITTNHLVAFATAGGAEARWCFSTAEPGASGELAVGYHHQDEPELARDVATGAPVDPGKAPDHDGFTAWLAAYVDRFAGPAKKSAKKPAKTSTKKPAKKTAGASKRRSATRASSPKKSSKKAKKPAGASKRRSATRASTAKKPSRRPKTKRR